MLLKNLDTIKISFSGEWIDKLVYLYNGILVTIKKINYWAMKSHGGNTHAHSSVKEVILKRELWTAFIHNTSVKWVFFPSPHQPVLNFPDTRDIQQLCSVLTVTTQIAQTLGVKDFPLSVCAPYFLLVTSEGLGSEVPPYAFFRFYNLLMWLTELRKARSLKLLVCYKGYNPGATKWERYTVEGTRDCCAQSFQACSSHAARPAPQCVHQLKLSQYH